MMRKFLGLVAFCAIFWGIQDEAQALGRCRSGGLFGRRGGGCSSGCQVSYGTHCATSGCSSGSCALTYQQQSVYQQPTPVQTNQYTPGSVWIVDTNGRLQPAPAEIRESINKKE